MGWGWGGVGWGANMQTRCWGRGMGHNLRRRGIRVVMHAWRLVAPEKVQIREQCLGPHAIPGALHRVSRAHRTYRLAQ